VSRVRVSATVPGPQAAVRALWFDPGRWPSFVDGLTRVARVEGDWPADGRVVWDCKRKTRQRVVEVAEGPDVVRVEDVRITGTQRLRLEDAGDGLVRMTVELDYRVKDGPGVKPLVDLLLVRRALGDGLRRTLRRFLIEREAEAVTMDA
jgi:hypothetical protein